MGETVPEPLPGKSLPIWIRSDGLDREQLSVAAYYVQVPIHDPHLYLKLDENIMQIKKDIVCPVTAFIVILLAFLFLFINMLSFHVW